MCSGFSMFSVLLDRKHGNRGSRYFLPRFMVQQVLLAASGWILPKLTLKLAVCCWVIQIVSLSSGCLTHRKLSLSLWPEGSTLIGPDLSRYCDLIGGSLHTSSHTELPYWGHFVPFDVFWPGVLQSVMTKSGQDWVTEWLRWGLGWSEDCRSRPREILSQTDQQHQSSQICLHHKWLINC